MGADNPIADAEAKARAFAGLLGGEEGIEDAFRVGYAGAVINKGHFDVVFRATRANADAAVIAGFLDGVIGVIEDVQENLLQLLRVAECGAKIFIELLGHLYAMAGEVVAAQLDGLAEDRVHVHWFLLRGALARES